MTVEEFISQITSRSDYGKIKNLPLGTLEYMEEYSGYGCNEFEEVEVNEEFNSVFLF